MGIKIAQTGYYALCCSFKKESLLLSLLTTTHLASGWSINENGIMRVTVVTVWIPWQRSWHASTACMQQARTCAVWGGATLYAYLVLILRRNSFSLNFELSAVGVVKRPIAAHGHVRCESGCLLFSGAVCRHRVRLQFRAARAVHGRDLPRAPSSEVLPA